MDDGTALLAAIALHPDEDVPRLAYADWLDEHNFPIRAEFIRVQCEIKRVEAAEDNRRYVALYRRQDELLTNHRRELLGPLGDEVTDAEINTDIVFERGFLTELRLDGKRFLKYADAISELKPLPDIAVHIQVNWEPHGDLRYDFRRVELITEFEMSPGYRVASDFTDLAPLSRSLWSRLRKLNLSGCDLGYEGLFGLANLATVPELTDLDLWHNEIPDIGIRDLVRSPLWPRLKSLVLDSNPISDEGAELLADAPPTALRFLNMRNTAITHVGHQRLLRRKGWNVALF